MVRAVTSGKQNGPGIWACSYELLGNGFSLKHFPQLGLAHFIIAPKVRKQMT